MTHEHSVRPQPPTDNLAGEPWRQNTWTEHVWKAEGMRPDDLRCSRNARSEKAPHGRAQWKITAPILEKKMSELGGMEWLPRQNEKCPAPNFLHALDKYL